MHDEVMSFNDILNDFIVILEQHSEVLRLILRGDHTASFVGCELEKSNKRIEIMKDSMNRFNSKGMYLGVIKTADVKNVSILNSTEHIIEYAWSATQEMIDNGFQLAKSIFTPLGITSIIDDRTVVFTMTAGSKFPSDEIVVW